MKAKKGNNIMKYTVIEHDINHGTIDFINEVNEMINKGWKPFGNMCAIVVKDIGYYSQAMTKEYNNENL